ncbi:galactosyl transferase GMA12/MNN10 family protein [Variovorax boronicumulans]|uniref:galactosyl transferase GMA12/MNN10 family protein n=1 Tax=Variovorax boronicumulans TaxID=436515 RepID=UPI0007846E44|nr:galactosyl transferase GMA12/MNN10 family protein [Variovorax boronicumulans]
MPLCLTFFDRLDEPVLRNHSHYCRRFGYPHAWVETERAGHPALRDCAKYAEMLRRLRGLDEGDWLLLLDGDSVVFHPVAVETMMEGRDLLVVDGPKGLPLCNLMILRNTAANRALLHALIRAASQVVARVTPRLDAAELLRPAGLLLCNGLIGDCYVNVSWRIANWFTARIFVVHLAPLVELDAEGRVLDELLHDANLQRLLVRRVNAALTDGEPVLPLPAYPAISEDVYSCVNPQAPIAFVTLYTHHINDYARVSEHNVRRYCERHGYGYHVYRAIPGELDPSISGAWVKSWLVKRHLAQHQWVVWIDADTLFVNQTQRIEPLLEGRDLLFAKDIGAWDVNSGVMGFRHTERNLELLTQLWERITGVDDKSTVYASQGDQYYTNVVLGEHGLIGDAVVTDLLSINTPPHLAGDDSLLVHFVGLGEPYRSVYMADVDARSKRLG